MTTLASWGVLLAGAGIFLLCLGLAALFLTMANEDRETRSGDRP